jgi:hypothetical protein
MEDRAEKVEDFMRCLKDFVEAKITLALAESRPMHNRCSGMDAMEERADMYENILKNAVSDLLSE